MTPEQALRECQVFQRLTDDQLQKVAPLCSHEVYKAGITIFRAGNIAERLFVLVDGKVALQMELPVQESQLRKRVTVDVVNRNELFGWSGLVEPYIYTLSAICLQEAGVLAIDAPRLSALLRDDCGIAHEVLYGITNVVASRLHDTMQMLVAERSLV